MKHGSPDHAADVAENNETVFSIGSQEGNPLNRKGDLRRQAGKVLGIAHHNKKGTIDETLDDVNFEHKVNHQLAAGSKNIRLDFEQDPDFADSTVERVKELGRKLWNEKGQVSLTITGLTEARVEELRRAGMEINGIKLYSINHTKEAFTKPAEDKKKDAAAAPFEMAA